MQCFVNNQKTGFDEHDVTLMIHCCTLCLSDCRENQTQHHKSVIRYVGKIPGSGGSSCLAHPNTIRKLTALWEWGGSAGATHTCIYTHTDHQPQHAAGTTWHWLMHRASLPSPSVLASPGTPRSSRAGAAPGVPPARSAA